jgi:hypothetical protein
MGYHDAKNDEQMKIQKFISLLILVLFIANTSFSQRTFSNVKKVSNGAGTFWVGLGLNRTSFATSDIQFKNRFYDFTLEGVKAKDLADKVGSQLNLSSGYYYMNRYALTFGLNQTNYVMNDGNAVFLTGKINEGVDSTWSGAYNGKAVVTNRNDFHYQTKLDYIHIGLTGTEQLAQSRNKMIGVSASLGLNLGCVISSTNFNFESRYDYKKTSLSGFAFNMNAAIRLELLRHFYIQGELIGGSMIQGKVLTRRVDDFANAKQKFWFGQAVVSAGFLIYTKPLNGCNDCPNW